MFAVAAEGREIFAAAGEEADGAAWKSSKSSGGKG